MEEAIKAGKDASYEVHWKPFYLNHSVPPEGEDLYEHLKKKYGPSVPSPANPSNPLNVVGRQVGITFNSQRRVVDTRNSHRLIEYAKDSGKEDQMVETLFRVYFQEGKDISKIDVLVAAAEEAGLDGSKVRAFLLSDEKKEKIDREANEAMRAGVHGVPHFTITTEGKRAKVVLSGAQEPQTFLDAFEQVLDA